MFLRKLFTLLFVVAFFLAIFPELSTAQDGSEVPSVELTADSVSSVVAIIVSLALAYIPGLKTKWDDFSNKREVLALIGVVVTAGIVATHYFGWYNIGIVEPFGWPVVWQALSVWLVYAGAAQLAYTFTKSLG